MEHIRIITFVVTEACQLQCVYCYLVGKNDTNKMSLGVAQRAIDYIFSEPKLDSDEIILDFIGGEPLLEINLINEIVCYFRAKANDSDRSWREKFSIRITTNGLLYTSARVQDFIRTYHDHLRMSISIDGNRDKTNVSRIYINGKGSYDDVVKSIPLWRKQFPDEGTKMTISHNDLPYVFESVKHLVSLGIHKIDVNPVLENVWYQGDDQILENQLIKCADFIFDNHLENVVYLSCFEKNLGIPDEIDAHYTYGICGTFMLAINYKGDFYPCLRFAKFALGNKPERSIGNVFEGINWNLMRPFKSFCNQITSDKCMQCDLHNGCKICPAENYDSSSSSTIYEQSLYACAMHKAKVRANNYFWCKHSLIELKVI
jgi:uncharacterized protein